MILASGGARPHNLGEGGGAIEGKTIFLGGGGKMFFTQNGINGAPAIR